MGTRSKSKAVANDQVNLSNEEEDASSSITDFQRQVMEMLNTMRAENLQLREEVNLLREQKGTTPHSPVSFQSQGAKEEERSQSADLHEENYSVNSDNVQTNILGSTDVLQYLMNAPTANDIPI